MTGVNARNALAEQLPAALADGNQLFSLTFAADRAAIIADQLAFVAPDYGWSVLDVLCFGGSRQQIQQLAPFVTPDLLGENTVTFLSDRACCTNGDFSTGVVSCYCLACPCTFDMIDPLLSAIVAAYGQNYSTPVAAIIRKFKTEIIAAVTGEAGTSRFGSAGVSMLEYYLLRGLTDADLDELAAGTGALSESMKSAAANTGVSIHARERHGIDIYVHTLQRHYTDASILTTVSEVELNIVAGVAARYGVDKLDFILPCVIDNKRISRIVKEQLLTRFMSVDTPNTVEVVIGKLAASIGGAADVTAIMTAAVTSTAFSQTLKDKLRTVLTNPLFKHTYITSLYLIGCSDITVESVAAQLREA